MKFNDDAEALQEDNLVLLSADTLHIHYDCDVLRWNKSLHTWPQSSGTRTSEAVPALQSMLGSYIRNLRDQLQQRADRTRRRNKKRGQRPSPSLQTHQPGKEPKEMTPCDLTRPQVNSSGHHDDQRDFTG